jgi:hypothetical protein
MFVDSKQEKLDPSRIVMVWLRNNPNQPHPLPAMMAGILQELFEPNVKTKQFGNTLFEVITGDGDQAFFKAFNADTGENFVDNSKLFCVWARKVLGMKTLVTEFDDEALEKLFKIISMNPPMPGMGYQVMKTSTGKTRIVLNLGE